MTALARLADRRPKRILAVAVVLAVVAGVFGFGVANRLGPYGADDPATESVKTSNQLEHATGLTTTDSIVVLTRGPAVGVAQALRGDPAIGAVSPPTRARDGRSAYVVASFKRGAAQKPAVERVQKQLGHRAGVTVGGGAVANVAVNEIVQKDLTRAEMLAFPILFLLSFWFFRSLVASALPLLVGGLSIVLTFLGLRIASEAASLSVFALNLVTGLGLGLAIDYSLFMVSRYREELAKHGPGATALVNTVTSAGRTVLFSSLTVAAALASLLVFPQKFLYSMGVGGAMVSLIAAAVALTVLPAVLALLGGRVNALSPQRLRRAAETDARHEARGWWYRLSRLVMRRPARVAVLSAALLIALGLPFLGVKFTSVDATVLPKDEPARIVDTALKRDFPAGRTTPIVVAAHTAPGPAADRFARQLGAVQGVGAVAPPRAAGPGLTRIDVFTPYGDLSEQSQSLVRKLRALHAPFDVGVAGRTAAFVDQKQSLAAHIPVALAWLAITTFVVLFMFTGSVILPLKALVMNGLTISAAFGLLVLVFQHGRLESLLGYVSQGALESSQPVVLFAVAFGLSTDYGVFLLSRIKEARDSGVPDREAVAVGLERTGRIVTAAALLFCVAIGAFATSRIIFIKEVGLGTAVAVLIDATIVRALLVPSLMELLGRWNWWAPRPLRRLHARFGLDEGVANAAPSG
jgi:RND superfamily putative drug exporter